MYKLVIILLIATFFIGSTQAQQHPTIKDLTGSWNLTTMDISGRIYYNVETDSLYIRGLVELSDSIPKAHVPIVTDAMKQQFKDVSFTINSNGDMYAGNDSSKIMARYNPENGEFITIKTTEEESTQITLQDKKLVIKTEENGDTAIIICTRKP